MLSLEQLRRRTSMKWRGYPPDVLPLRVAEMDVPLADPIVRAVEHALAIGDTGYPQGTAYAEAVADFAAARWGRLLGELLAQRLPAVAYREPQGTYLAWLDCRGLGLSDDPAAVFLERGRVALNSGLLFGSGGAGHVRVNLATSPMILVDAVARMAAAVG